MNTKIKENKNDKNKLTKRMFNAIGSAIRINLLEAPHPTLVAFGIGISITIAIAVGISILTADHSHLAYAAAKKKGGKEFLF